MNKLNSAADEAVGWEPEQAARARVVNGELSQAIKKEM